MDYVWGKGSCQEKEEALEKCEEKAFCFLFVEWNWSKIMGCKRILLDRYLLDFSVKSDNRGSDIFAIFNYKFQFQAKKISLVPQVKKSLWKNQKTLGWEACNLC
jgi:hypothetical protein